MILLSRVLLAAVMVMLAGVRASAVEREVRFQTEDGWTISGMLNIPEGATGKVPAVIFLHSYEHDQDTYGQYLYAGLAQIIGARGVATLRFDFRGRGKSEGRKKLHEFSAREIENLHLDVRAAMEFLARQDAIDGRRIGIVAEGMSAEAAVRGWSGDERVPAVVLVSGRLSDEALGRIEKAPHVPLYLVVSKEDRESFRDMAAAYRLTAADESRIDVHTDMGMGTTMFSVWRSERQKEKPIEDRLADWMALRLADVGTREEVTFRTEDGWELHGTLWRPGGLDAGARVPGVVMVHTAFTDRHIYHHFARSVVREGMIALSFDTRGRGKSTGKGELLDLSPDERNRTNLDTRAAVRFLLSLPEVGRVGLVGADRGANYALQAATESDRAGALVLMTTLVNAPEREAIVKMNIPVFYIASTDIEAITNRSMSAAYQATPNRGSRLLLYRGGALGYEIFEADANLEPTLTSWLKEQLNR